jgi:hypothetical protein
MERKRADQEDAARATDPARDRLEPVGLAPEQEERQTQRRQEQHLPVRKALADVSRGEDEYDREHGHEEQGDLPATGQQDRRDERDRDRRRADPGDRARAQAHVQRANPKAVDAEIDEVRRDGSANQDADPENRDANSARRRSR